MTGRMVSFSFEILFCCALLFAAQYKLRKSEHRVIRTIVFIVKLLLIPVVAMLFIVVVNDFTYSHGDLLCALYVALLGDAAASVIEYLIRRSGKKSSSEGTYSCKQKVIAMISLICCALVTAYGAWNAWNVTMKTHEWTAKGLTKDHVFAFAADLHYGSAQTVDSLKDFVGQVNDADPEFVILGGDVVDELTSYEQMQETFSTLTQDRCGRFRRSINWQGSSHTENSSTRTSSSM